MGMLIKKLNWQKLGKVSENRPQLPNTPQLTNGMKSTGAKDIFEGSRLKVALQ